MSNVNLVIEERSRDIGAFLVGRLLPFAKKRMVGPFIFIDHMGPASYGPGAYFDIDQHPHIGLSTLTYLLEGEIMHADSMGTRQRISPGSVNFMTAGSGVSHTERTPADLRNGQTGQMHGYQIWVALPAELEEMSPRFQHLDASELPRWKENGLEFCLIAGKGYGHESPLEVFSPLFMVEVKAPEGGRLEVQGQVQGEIGICIVEGTLISDGEHLDKGHMLVSKTENQCAVELAPGTHLLLFGGDPFSEERHIFWNFVSSRKERLEQAKSDWATRQFPMMEDDATYIPLPEIKNLH